MPSTVVVVAGSLAALLVVTTVAPATGFPYWSSTSPWMEANPTPRSGRRRSRPGSTVTEGTSWAQKHALPNKGLAHTKAAIQTHPRWRRPCGAQSSVRKVLRVIRGAKLLGNHSGEERTMRLQILGSAGRGIPTSGAPVSRRAKAYHRSSPCAKDGARKA
jgi:hypothetical protein